jgi:membrane dipeptidase
MIVDGHLDVAWNAHYNERDLTLPVGEIRAAEPPSHPAVAMTSLDGFSRGGVGLVFATLYATPASHWSSTVESYPMARPARPYSTPEEAQETALEMLDLYRRWEDEGRVRIIIDVPSLEEHLRRFADDSVPGFLLLMEGADPIVTPDDLPSWFDRGLRMIGLSWASTRYAGGTGSSSGLTDAGRELLAGMAELGIVHDAAHLSEESFWEAAGLPQRGLCVTHASARALMTSAGLPSAMPLNRFLSDAQIAEVARSHGTASRGVIGLAMLNAFLDPRWELEGPAGCRVATEDQVAAHLHHIAKIAGWESVGIGSDVDAAFGRDQTPSGLDTVEDWPALAVHVPEPARRGVLGENWLRFLRETLPPGRLA